MSGDIYSALAARAIAEARPTREGAAPSWRRDLVITDQAILDLIPTALPKDDPPPKTIKLAAKFKVIKPLNREPEVSLAGIDAYLGVETDWDHNVFRVTNVRGQFGPFTLRRALGWKWQNKPHIAEPWAATKQIEPLIPPMIAAFLDDPSLALEGAKAVGCCARCGRVLSDSVSLRLGLGPECRDAGYFSAKSENGTEYFIARKL
jgi:hypothetical protein